MCSVIHQGIMITEEEAQEALDKLEQLLTLIKDYNGSYEYTHVQCTVDTKVDAQKEIIRAKVKRYEELIAYVPGFIDQVEGQLAQLERLVHSYEMEDEGDLESDEEEKQRRGEAYNKAKGELSRLKEKHQILLSNTEDQTTELKALKPVYDTYIEEKKKKEARLKTLGQEIQLLKQELFGDKSRLKRSKIVGKIDYLETRNKRANLELKKARGLLNMWDERLRIEKEFKEDIESQRAIIYEHYMDLCMFVTGKTPKNLDLVIITVEAFKTETDKWLVIRDLLMSIYPRNSLHYEYVHDHAKIMDNAKALLSLKYFSSMVPYDTVVFETYTVGEPIWDADFRYVEGKYTLNGGSQTLKVMKDNDITINYLEVLKALGRDPIEAKRIDSLWYLVFNGNLRATPCTEKEVKEVKFRGGTVKTTKYVNKLPEDFMGWVEELHNAGYLLVETNHLVTEGGFIGCLYRTRKAKNDHEKLKEEMGIQSNSK